MHSDYKPECCYWLVAEKIQQMVLVGIMHLFWPGSFIQIGLALLYVTMHSFLLLRIWPYKSHRRNNLAAMTGMALFGLFFCAGFLRVLSLTEEPAINKRMSSEQAIAFDVPANSLTYITFACVVGCFVLLAAVSMARISEEMQLKMQLSLAKSSRRLRYIADDRQVLAPSVGPDEFHLFLSHVWSTAQGVPVAFSPVLLCMVGSWFTIHI